MNTQEEKIIGLDGMNSERACKLLWKTINIADENRWDFFGMRDEPFGKISYAVNTIAKRLMVKLMWYYNHNNTVVLYSMRDVLFDHGFAEAFFNGKIMAKFDVHLVDENGKTSSDDYVSKGHKYHLQKMSLEKNPLNYISNYLNNQ